MRRFCAGVLVKAALFSVGLLLVGIGCNPEQSLGEVLTGKSCREDKPKCVDPYVCNEQTKFCVMPSELPAAAGSSGSGIGDLSPAGAGGTPQEVSTNDGPTVGGEGGAAGSESPAAGAGGVSSTDPDVGEVDAGCTKVQIFIDRDGDGYGSAAAGDSKFDCLVPGWVAVGGDCLDAVVTADNRANQVHPEQTEFFLDGYPLPDQPGEVSFDYDCSSQEEGDPNNSKAGAAGDCDAATTCTAASGIVPTDRSGPKVNSLCGSKTIQLCLGQPNQCAPGPSAGTAFKCH
jgi:hypothetical protein